MRKTTNQRGDIDIYRMGRRKAFQFGNYLLFGVILVSINVGVQAQNTSGFLSIDCGSFTAPYTDSVTQIQWEGDSQYTYTGSNGQVPPGSVNLSFNNYQALETFRYFPNGPSKNCYELQTTAAFLLRAMFLHGNSSELSLPIQFDVAVNATTWFTVEYFTNDTDEVLNTPINFEGIFPSSGNLTHFCLVRDIGVPFISSLELRQLDPDLHYFDYVSPTNGLYLTSLYRVNCGAQIGSPTVRYPDDIHDRLWESPGSSFAGLPKGTGSALNSTSSTANNVPVKVMQDAWVNDTANSSFGFSFSDLNTEVMFDNAVTQVHYGSAATQLYVFAYVEEIESNAAFGHRNFTLTMLPLAYVYPIITARDTPLPYVFANCTLSFGDAQVNFTLTALTTSILGPIVNAIEIYAYFPFNDSATATNDVEALGDLKESFNLRDWQGDPCYPISWEWVSCTLDTPARVDSLMLANMNIDASIPSSLSSLSALTYINLSNNRLYGSIPGSLASLPELDTLFLNNNNLSGEVPTALVTYLGPNFQYSGNNLLAAPSPVPSTNTAPSPVPSTNTAPSPAPSTNTAPSTAPSTNTGPSPAPSTNKVPSPAPSTNTATDKKSSKNIGIIAGPVVAGVLVLVIGVLWYFCFWSKKEKQSFRQEEIGIPIESTTPTPAPSQPPNRPTEVGHVSYETVKSATNNFDTEIGRGSYGSVYRGFLNNREVAVKVNNLQSQQGHHEFITEVDILTRVHHKNLVSLIAYCTEGRELILVYEFEANGTLQNRLHDDGNSQGTLDWKKRLEIAADGAKGLEYLHKGCHPAIIHRDVKPSNILLDRNMTAKVADFGLSKHTPVENSSGYSTEVKGTLGYLDPEYCDLQKLTPKSDVFSYGVVLAEIITGLPPYFMQPGRMSPIHLKDWMRKLVERNDIQALADPNLQANFNPESMWRMADTALACLDPVGSMRPDFTQVVNEINEAMALQQGFDVHNPAVRTILGSFVSKPSTSNGYQNLSIS